MIYISIMNDWTQTLVKDLSNPQVNDFQRELIQDVLEEKYDKIKDKIPVIGEHEIWESVLFAVTIKAQSKLIKHELSDDYVMSWVWENIIEIMDAKRENKPYKEQKRILYGND